MTKTELIEKVSENAEISKKDAKKAVDAVFDIIAETVKAGGDVQIIGFGKFEQRVVSAHEGRNPRTGEPLQIDAYKKMAMKPAKNMTKF